MSSYRSYIGQCTTTEGLKTDFILGYFGRIAPDAKNKYRRFVEDLLDSEYESPLKAAIASTVLGRSEFVREVTERHLPHFPFNLRGNYRELIEGD